MGQQHASPLGQLRDLPPIDHIGLPPTLKNYILSGLKVWGDVQKLHRYGLSLSVS